MKKIGIVMLIAVIVTGFFFFQKKNANIDDTRNSEAQPQQIEIEKNIKLVTVDEAEDIRLIFDIAEKKGFFSDEGLKVDALFTRTNPYQILIAGESDIAISTLPAAISIYLSEASPKVVATPFQGFGQVAVSRFPKGEESRIERVAVGRIGGGPHITMEAALKDLGLFPENVEILQVSGDAPRFAAISKEEVDFTFLQGETALKEFGVGNEFALYYSDELNAAQDRAVVASEKSLQEKRGEIKSFLTAIHKAIEYLSVNPDEAKIFIKENYEIDDESTERMYRQFSVAKERSSFIPDHTKWEVVVERVRRISEPTNPDKDISGLIYDELAKEILISE